MFQTAQARTSRSSSGSSPRSTDAGRREDELAELVAPDIRFTERPNLINPGGSERDRAAMRAGLEAGRQLLAWQSYEVRDHVASGDTVVTRMR